MPQRKCAIKRLRADKKRRSRNLRLKKNLKNTIKSFMQLITDSKAEEAQAAIKKVLATVDKAVAKGILHKKTAARKKSLLTRKLKTLKK